jgi:hypothetical protein
LLFPEASADADMAVCGAPTPHWHSHEGDHLSNPAAGPILDLQIWPALRDAVLDAGASVALAMRFAMLAYPRVVGRG